MTNFAYILHMNIPITVGYPHVHFGGLSAKQTIQERKHEEEIFWFRYLTAH